MNERLSGMRAILISESNYELLNQYYSFDDYDAFYQELVPIEHPLPSESTLPEDEVPTDGSTLDEPLQNLPPVDETQPEEEDDGEEVEEDGGSYYVY